MASSTDNPRDLDADLALCEDVAGVELQSINAVGKMLRFAREAVKGWPAALRHTREVEDENDKLREENAMLQEQLQQHHRSHCYD